MGDPGDENPCQDELVGGHHGGRRRQRYLELVDAILGVKLLDGHPGSRHRGHHVADERLVLKQPGEPVRRPQLSWQPVPRRVDQQELDLVAEPGRQALLLEPGLDARERSAGAFGHPIAVLIEERRRGPGQPVLDLTHRMQVDPEPVVAHDGDGVGEGDSGPVDRKSVPCGTGSQAGISESCCRTC